MHSKARRGRQSAGVYCNNVMCIPSCVYPQASSMLSGSNLCNFFDGKPDIETPWTE